MAIRPMRAEEMEPVLDLLESAFDKRALFERYIEFDPLWRPDDFLLDVENGRPRSCVQVFEKRIRLRGSEVKLGGIGSVATAAGSRAHGLASELMRRQTEAMRARGMPLALLFAGPVGFYENLGWHQFPMPHAVLRRTPGTRERVGRPFEPADLPSVAALYDAYSDGVDGTTLRDESYWRGQLRYAGAPGEDFRVLERGGVIVAYARATRLESIDVVLEYACAPGHSRELAQLVAALCPEGGALAARIAPDPQLEPSLKEEQLEVSHFPDRSGMWRVLDRARLAELADLAPDSDDLTLLRELHATPLHYWLADRF